MPQMICRYLSNGQTIDRPCLQGLCRIVSHISKFKIGATYNAGVNGGDNPLAFRSSFYVGLFGAFFFAYALRFLRVCAFFRWARATSYGCVSWMEERKPQQ